MEGEQTVLLRSVKRGGADCPPPEREVERSRQSESIITCRMEHWLCLMPGLLHA